MIRGTEHLSCEERLRKFSCSAWKREGSGETLEQPSSTRRGLQESWRGILTRAGRDRTRRNGFKLK